LALLVVGAVGLAGALCALALVGAQVDEPVGQICIYVKGPALLHPVGHGFVQFLPTVGPQATKKYLVYGHRPGSVNFVSGKGKTEQDNKHS
jgi:hypothetical protein